MNILKPKVMEVDGSDGFSFSNGCFLKLQTLMFRGLQEFALFAQICRKNLKLRTIEEVGVLGTPGGKNVEFTVRNCLAGVY